MNKARVDLGIDATSGTYTIQLSISEGIVDLTPAEANTIIADLAAAASLATTHSAKPITEAPRVTRGARPGVTKWTRRDTGDYITELPTGESAEVYNGDKGWVAMIGDRVISDVVKSKRAAQNLIMEQSKIPASA